MNRHPSAGFSDESSTAAPSPANRVQGLLARMLLLLFDLIFAAVAFLALDWTHASPILRKLEADTENVNCRISDPVRHHALKPTVPPWDIGAVVPTRSLPTAWVFAMTKSVTFHPSLIGRGFCHSAIPLPDGPEPS